MPVKTIATGTAADLTARAHPAKTSLFFSRTFRRVFAGPESRSIDGAERFP